MATTSSSTPSGPSSATTRKSTSARKPAGSTARKAATTTSTQPKTQVEQIQDIAERAVLVPVGATILAQENLVSTVKGLATKYRTRASLERELKRYERRGATARNRFERQVRKTRTRVERELRQRRSRVERTVKQNRRRLEREVRAVRKDFEKQSSVVSKRAQEHRFHGAGAPRVTDRPIRLTPPRHGEAGSRDRFAGLIPRRRMQHPLLPQPPGRHASGAPSVLNARLTAVCGGTQASVTIDLCLQETKYLMPCAP